MPRREVVTDVVLAVSLTAYAQAEIWAGPHPATVVGPKTVYAVALGLAGLALLVRRRHPAAVLAAQCLVLGVEAAALGGSEGLGPVLLLAAGVYAVAAHGDERRVLACWPLLVFAVVHDLRDPAIGGLADELGALPFYGLLVGAWLVGDSVRTRRQFVRTLRINTELRLREQDERAERAVAEERLRIARDLHDSLAHGITLMIRQTEAALARWDSAPGTARDNVTLVAEHGREAMSQVRQLVALLRQGQPGAQVSERQGVGDLESLLEAARASGLVVGVERQGCLEHLGGPAALTVFRIVQEAITNATRHGRASRVQVTLACDGRQLAVDVVDDGIGPQPGAVPGHGLLGMQERVGLHAGSLHTGPGSCGGYRVQASLPLGVPA